MGLTYPQAIVVGPARGTTELFGARGQVLAGSTVSALAASASVRSSRRWSRRWSGTRTLAPFGICRPLLAAAGSVILLAAE